MAAALVVPKRSALRMRHAPPRDIVPLTAVPTTSQIGEGGDGDKDSAGVASGSSSISSDDETLTPLRTLGTNLCSPARAPRRVRFAEESSRECNVDTITGATVYHNGRAATFRLARRRPGQTGYQILSCDTDDGHERLSINTDQPFKVVMSVDPDDDENSGADSAARPSEHVYAGCMARAGCRVGGGINSTGTSGSTFTDCTTGGDEDAVYNTKEWMIPLVPVRQGHCIRLRMDLLLDADGKCITAVLISAGRAPPHTALQRLQGYIESPASTALRVLSPKMLTLLVMQCMVLMLLGSFMRTPAHSLHEKWLLSKDAELLTATRRIINSSRSLRQEFGAPAFDKYDSLFDYQVDLYTDTRASFLLHFKPRDDDLAFRTREWELEGTQNAARDDEITVMFDRRFRYGEATVEAARAGVGVPWHHTSIRLDLYLTERNYADTMVEWLVETVQRTFGSGTYQVHLEERRQHLRIKLEIGQDSDRDGDAERGEAGRIIRETAQLINDKRIVGFLRPDND